ncbi:YggT family protein [Wolinella succinogenes]|uniref:YggT family protein n=1 Tax=Wolinella succinogenes TaxID=844 RepID=UPI00240A9A46|nr:YggT family protein [Wolinella succinogenes]
MIFSTLIEAIAQILHMILNLYMWVIIIAALISWVRPDPYNPIVQILSRLTEPLYYQLRRKIPTVFSGIDLAPLIVIIALQFLDLFLVKLLFGLARSL